jgi:hypothetical protein
VLAFLLALILGPLGLLYVKVVPALLLVAVTVAASAALGIRSKTALAVSIVVWIVSIVWASLEAARRHHAFERWRASTGTQGVPRSGDPRTPAYQPPSGAPPDQSLPSPKD